MNETERELRRIIDTSRDVASEDSRRVLHWMIDRTEGLTKPLTVIFSDAAAKLGEEVAKSVHDMVSCNGKTHLDKFWENAQPGAGFMQWTDGRDGTVSSAKVWFHPVSTETEYGDTKYRNVLYVERLGHCGL